MGISLGNFVTIGDKQVGSGIVSGLDTGTLIDGLVAVKRIPAVEFEEDLEINASQTTELGVLRTTLDAFKIASDFLRNPPGINNDASNIFEYRIAALTISGSTSTPQTFLTVTADPGASLSAHQITIGNLAEAKSDRSEAFASKTADITEAAGDTTSGLFSAGTFQIGTTVNTNIKTTNIAQPILATTSYATDDDAVGILTTAGIAGFSVPSIGGDLNLQGAVPTFTASYEGTSSGTVDLSVTFGSGTATTTFTATEIDADGGDIDVATVITMTDGAGTSFTMTIGASPVTMGSQANADTFETDLATALAPQTIMQSRQLGSFSTTKVVSSILAELTSADVTLTSHEFDNTSIATSIHGEMTGFTVSAVSGQGTDDGSIAVTINGEVYTASGLGVATVNALDELASVDYTTEGNADGILTSEGVENITAPSTGGAVSLQGLVSGITATWQSSDTTVDLSVTLNGTTYTSVNNSAAGGDIDDEAVLTFTDGGTNATTFTLTINGAQAVTDQTTAETFATNLNTALDDQLILQNRQLANYDVKDTYGTVIDGLAQSHVTLKSEGFSTTDGTHGVFGSGSFTFTYAGGGNNTISVVIDGETYTNTSVADTLNTSLTLTSTTEIGGTATSYYKSITLDFATAGVSVDISEQSKGNTLMDALDDTFGTFDTHSGNIVLVNASDSKQTLNINLADANLVLDLKDANNAAVIEAALDAAFGTAKLGEITIAEDATLEAIETAINAQSSKTGVSATIIQISDTDFRIILSSDETGLKNSFTLFDLENVTSQVTFTATQAAEDAKLGVDGVYLTRSSNSINDIISGVTFNLQKVMDDSITSQGNLDTYLAGSPIIVTSDINHDTTTAEAGVINFINAYNDFRIFTDKQTNRDENGNLREDSVLAQNALLNTLTLLFGTEINRVVSGTSDTGFSSLPNLKITLTDFAGDDDTPETSNILTYDPATLSTILLNNFEKFREVFEFSFTSNSTDLSVFSTANTIDITDYTLDIDTTRSSGNQVRVLDTSGTFLFNMDDPVGTKIEGKDDTDLEGLTLVYSGDGTDVIAVQMSQGLADRFYNILNDTLRTDGTLDVSIQETDDEKTRIQKEIDKIDDQIDKFRDALLLKFTALEVAIARINTLLDFIEAQNKSIFDS